MRLSAAILTVAALSTMTGCDFGVGMSTEPPVVASIAAEPASVQAGQQTTITISAYDMTGTAVTYAWYATDGTVAGTGNTVTWTAPNTAGTYTVTCLVQNGRSEGTNERVSITVT